jgi:hypothetical protein|tara:strand:- start:8 stop:568 length:561 start_codon:yes stop_codon:yes gene_type:complete
VPANKKIRITEMKKNLLLLLICLTISCSKDSDEPIISNHTIIQSVKINVPIGPQGDYTTTYSEFDFSPLYSHTDNIYNVNIQKIEVKSVSYVFKNLDRYDNIILDSYSISFNGIEIENNTNQTDLLQVVNQNTIFQIENQELFERLAEGILINESVSVSSFGTLQWDGNPNDFEIEVIINIDVIEK